MDTCLAAKRNDTGHGRRFVLLLFIGALVLAAGPVFATSIVPITARELFARADVIVHGTVVSSHVGEDALGRPETITRIMPLEVLKGQVFDGLVLHQLGGELPDGRFFKLWGRPEYQAGHEVVVFAIARPEGNYQTAELVLGKFAVQQDERGRRFAVPALVADAPVQVTVMRHRPNGGPGNLEATRPDDTLAPRDLDGFLRSLRRGDGTTPEAWAAPRGALTSRVHPEYLPEAVTRWFNIGDLWRWNNGATAVWTLDGLANISGGGTAEATNATVTWSAEPDSTINFTIGADGVNPIHLNALSSPCGWTTCMAGGGVIGCGGPSGFGSNSWRGETYATITVGEVWLRSYCTLDLWDSVTTEAVLTHELGHTLGLGHSDQGASSHDVCRGDETTAQMRSYVQYRTTLGTDDQDAVRWLYGDGGNSCNGGGPTLSVTKTGAGTGTVTSVPPGISCGSACSVTFADGTVVTLSAAPGTNSVFTGWSGDADCTDSSVTIDASKTCTATFDLRPDLLISSLTVPSSALANSMISVSETTKNKGGPAAASTTRYYLSTNSTLGAGDVSLGFRNVPALQPGGSSLGSTAVLVPSGTAPGTYYVIATANVDNPILETNGANNTRSSKIVIGPDLILSSLSAPATGGAGLAIDVIDTTKNQGGGSAAASRTAFYLSANATLGSDVPLGSRAVGILQPSSSQTMTTRLTIPLGTAAGSYYIIAVADDGGAVPETNEANNTRAVLIRLSPDLIVSSMTVSPSAAAGSSITITETTRNQGAGTAIATTTKYHLSNNRTFDATADVFLASRDVPLLVTGASSVGPQTVVTIPPGTAAGNYYILAVTDADHVVAELNENNNTTAKPITISP